MIWNDDTEQSVGVIRDEKYGKLTITYVDIIRCKDCKWRNTKACFCKAPNDVQDDWFCSEGDVKN